MSCRRDYRDLSTGERDLLVEALYHVKATGLVDSMAQEHADHFGHGIHRSSHFLYWHRDFIWRFERGLKTYDPDIALPYWNSVEDQSTGAELWDNSFLGQFDSAWGLGRSLGSTTLPTAGDLSGALALTAYDAFWPNVEGRLHSLPHIWVGGQMAGAASPGDPVFFFHHCWIDVIFAQWQMLNPGAPYISSGPGHGFTDPMHSVSTTPADVDDHRWINIYHFPSGFAQQDLPRATLETPTINFIDVPEGETRMVAAVFGLDACDPLHLIATTPADGGGNPVAAFGTYPITATSMGVIVDPEVDVKGRLWFTYTGTNPGDTATATSTITCPEGGAAGSVVTLTANTIARPTAAVAMVLDQSNSMTFDSGIGPDIDRATVLRVAAPTAIDVLDEDNAVSVNTFDQDAHAGIDVTPAAGFGKMTISGQIASYAPNPNGWTSIGEGLAFAHGLLDPVTGYDVKAIVVLTDGQENHGGYDRRYISDVADLISGMNGHVFAIGLGRPEVLNPAALQALCSGNNGYMLITGDLNPDAYFRLAKYYQQIFAGVTNNEIVLDPEGRIGPGQVHRIPFWLNEADIEAKSILLNPAPYAISMTLETPQGDVINPGVAAAHPSASFNMGSQVELYRTGLPLALGANNAHGGLWHAVLEIERRGWKKYLTSLENNPELQQQTAVHGIPYSFNVHAWSNLRMRVSLTQTDYEPGATMTVRALLTEFGLPVAGRAACEAHLTRPDWTTATLGMLEVEPGVFEASTVASMDGVYQFRIMAQGHTMRGRPFTREQLRTGAVWRGGNNPPPTSSDDPNRGNERFCNLVNCLLRSKSVQEALRRAGIEWEELLRCLAAFCRKEPPPGRKPVVGLADHLRRVIKDEGVIRDIVRESGGGAGGGHNHDHPH